MNDSENFIPDVIKVGKYKHDSRYSFLTMKRRGGAYLFVSDFVHFTGYTPVDKPRDSIVAFERDATDKVRSYDNVPTEGFKIIEIKVFQRQYCIKIEDPRGWQFCLGFHQFIHLLKNGVDVNNQILTGKFVYSVVEDDKYNLVLIDSQDYQTAIKECEEKIRLKNLMSNKQIKLVPGVVYDYLYDKSNVCRAIYMGKLSRVIGDSLAKWYRFKNFSEDKFNLQRHIWLLLIDEFHHKRFIYACGKIPNRFNILSSGRLIMKYDEIQKRIVREHDLLMNYPLKKVDHIDEMYFDDYFTEKHNFEFKLKNIISTPSINKLNIKSVSKNQSYRLEKANYERTHLHESFKDPAVAFPIEWTFNDLKTAVNQISEDWFRFYTLNNRNWNI